MGMGNLSKNPRNVPAQKSRTKGNTKVRRSPSKNECNYDSDGTENLKDNNGE
jgi:hypothetical protein